MIFNYQKLPYYKRYNYFYKLYKKNILANNNYIYYLISIAISLFSIILAVIYIITFAENINKKIK